MNGAKRSAEAVGCKNESIKERFALEGRTRVSSGGRSICENVSLSNANVGENPMPQKPKGSSARFIHGGVIKDKENASSQSSSIRHYSAEVIHVIFSGKARTSFNKWAPETDTGGKVWHLDVDSSPPEAVVCSKGWAIRPLKRHSPPIFIVQLFDNMKKPKNLPLLFIYPRDGKAKAFGAPSSQELRPHNE
ncbi:hypothetical protein E2542_SST30731 [Spatholobus suberectus]|nr:hypothetical protein E2542_SST30731 [Spatholobus suberectus]